jgi:hypothetical protein
MEYPIEDHSLEGMLKTLREELSQRNPIIKQLKRQSEEPQDVVAGNVSLNFPSKIHSI